MVSAACSGVRADVGNNIWKTASSVLRLPMCKRTVPLQYFGYFFNDNKKCARIAVGFATTSFGIKRKLKRVFSLKERVRKEID